jgi:hypothetical protein
MRRFITLAAIICVAGCTTLQPMEGTSDELRARINSGGLLEVGDRVAIVTDDYATHEFRIRAIRDGIIEGKSDSVPVAHTISVEKRQFSRAKTLLLVGGAVTAVSLALYVAAQAVPAFALSGAP